MHHRLSRGLTAPSQDLTAPSQDLTAPSCAAPSALPRLHAPPLGHLSGIKGGAGLACSGLAPRRPVVRLGGSPPSRPRSRRASRGVSGFASTILSCASGTSGFAASSSRRAASGRPPASRPRSCRALRESIRIRVRGHVVLSRGGRRLTIGRSDTLVMWCKKGARMVHFPETDFGFRRVSVRFSVSGTTEKKNTTPSDGANGATFHAIPMHSAPFCTILHHRLFPPGPDRAVVHRPSALPRIRLLPRPSVRRQRGAPGLRVAHASDLSMRTEMSSRPSSCRAWGGAVILSCVSGRGRHPVVRLGAGPGSAFASVVPSCCLGAHPPPRP